MAERGGHTALHLACRVRAHTCACVLLQPRPSHPRDASDTYLTQSQNHTPDTSHAPVAMDPQSNPENEEEEEEPRDEDWRLQLEAENYDGERPGPWENVSSRLSSPNLRHSRWPETYLSRGVLTWHTQSPRFHPSIGSTLVYACNTRSRKLEAQEVRVIFGAI